MPLNYSSKYFLYLYSHEWYKNNNHMGHVYAAKLFLFH